MKNVTCPPLDSQTAPPPLEKAIAPIKVAIVHDWLVSFAGAERVLAEILHIYPHADLYAVIDFLSDADRARLGAKRAQTTFIQRLPGASRSYRRYLPLMPLAIEQLDMGGYDLVISSSHAVAKGVLTGPDQTHICYCHTPIRYAWDLQHQYLRESGLISGLKGGLARLFLHYIRLWDVRTEPGVDYFVANSHYIARRIKKIYGREATVIYPPVDVASFPLEPLKKEFYVTASRLVPYKRVELIVRAFCDMPDRQLVVIGDGPQRPEIEKLASTHANINYLGYQPGDVLKQNLQQARAFIFAAEEDFGILPVEAQACGTPVIAYARGGVRETVKGLEHKEPTGVFFTEQSIESVQEAVKTFEASAHRIKPENCRTQALLFESKRFREEFRAFVAAQSALIL